MEQLIINLKSNRINQKKYYWIHARWSFIPYLRKTSASIEVMLNPIVSNIEIVKNGMGQTYWPAWNVNLIGNMNPGEGYQVKMNELL